LGVPPRLGKFDNWRLRGGGDDNGNDRFSILPLVAALLVVVLHGATPLQRPA